VSVQAVVERDVMPTVHVTNVAFTILSAQRFGWHLVGAKYIVPGQTMQLEFERPGLVT
jgi:hypothetical protein